jgi:hypothetical protein
MFKCRVVEYSAARTEQLTGLKYILFKFSPAEWATTQAIYVKT